ncbi:MAG: rod shape-determining protein MreC [Flavobacteriaceae bacterium]
MQKLLNSILRNGTLLLFILLFGLSLRFIAKNHNYQRSSLLAFNNAISAPFLEARYTFFSFFKRQVHNEQLVAENQYLLEQLITINNQEFLFDSIPFEVIPAQVIRNSIQLKHNHLTLNVGEKDGVKKEMGVITANGIVGVIENVSKKTSGVISLLNISLRINAKLKKSNHFGSLYWDSESPNSMVLSDVPLAAKVVVGDTIVTGGMSAIFPAEIPIGKVSATEVPLNDNYYNLSVSLFQDMTNLNQVYVVHFPSADEIKKLINDIENE